MQPDRQRTTGTGNAPNGKGKERAQQEIIELEDSETDSDHPDDVSFAEGIKVWEKENAHRRKPGPRKSEPNTTTSHRGVESASSNSDRRHSVGAMQPDTTCFVNEQPTIPALNVKRSQAMKGKVCTVDHIVILIQSVKVYNPSTVIKQACGFRDPNTYIASAVRTSSTVHC